MSKGYQVLLSMLLVAVSLSVQAITAQNYFPLQAGAEWDFSHKDIATYGPLSKNVLEDKVEVNGVITTVVEYSGGYKRYHTSDVNGIRFHREDLVFDDGDTGSWVFSPPLQIANLELLPPTKVEETISQRGVATFIFSDGSSYPFNYVHNSNEIGSGIEKLSLSIGEYDAYKLKYTTNISGSINGNQFSDQVVYALWLAKGLGAIKEGVNGEFTLLATNIPIGASSVTQQLIFWRNISNGQNWVYALNGASIESSGIINLLSDQNWQMAGRGDFNNDGWKDIFWRNQVTGENWMYLMDGTSVQQSIPVNTVGDTNWQIQSIDDFDGDGKADVLWRNKLTGEVGTYLMNGNQIKSIHSISTVADLNWQIRDTGDIDGDGKADVIWRHQITGEVGTYLMNGYQIKATHSIYQAGDLNWQLKGVGDFDGDGKADIVWRNGVTGENWMFQMNGHLIKQSLPIATVSDTQWDIITTEDFDRDGKNDLFWRHGTTGENWMFLMNGNAVKQSQHINTLFDENWKIAD